ncbi:MAG: hypothetical protein J6Q22_08000 [Prevotella sp.]|nr:hypothetical protein [Prevotella sp.]
MRRFKLGGGYHECPQCKRPDTFSNYIDTATGQPLHEDCGYCVACSYNYPPREYLKEDNDYFARTITDDYDGEQDQESVSFIPAEYIDNYLFKSPIKGQSCLTDYWLSIAPSIEPFLFDALNRYYVGHEPDNKGLRWPQIDAKLRVREIMIQCHGRFSGSRKDAEYQQQSEHYNLRNAGVLDKQSEQDTCLFGEHLLRNADGNTYVGIVESEKTALLCSAVNPDFIWLATCGKTKFLRLVSNVKQRLALCKKVTVFPDVGAQGEWKKYAETINLHNLEVSYGFLNHPNNTDIADLLVYEWMNTRKPIVPVHISDIKKSQPYKSDTLFQEQRKQPIKIRKTNLFPEPYNYDWLEEQMWKEILSPEAAYGYRFLR